MRMGSKMKRLLGTLLAAMPLLVPAGADAAGRNPVDPSIMQPALNPTFSWTLLANRRQRPPSKRGAARRRRCSHGSAMRRRDDLLDGDG
jgi:hypothetical protein